MQIGREHVQDQNDYKYHNEMTQLTQCITSCVKAKLEGTSTKHVLDSRIINCIFLNQGKLFNPLKVELNGHWVP